MAGRGGADVDRRADAGHRRIVVGRGQGLKTRGFQRGGERCPCRSLCCCLGEVGYAVAAAEMNDPGVIKNRVVKGILGDHFVYVKALPAVAAPGAVTA